MTRSEQAEKDYQEYRKRREALWKEEENMFMAVIYTYISIPFICAIVFIIMLLCH
jgi:hypothetical protein